MYNAYIVGSFWLVDYWIHRWTAHESLTNDSFVWTVRHGIAESSVTKTYSNMKVREFSCSIQIVGIVDLAATKRLTCADSTNVRFYLGYITHASTFELCINVVKVASGNELRKVQHVEVTDSYPDSGGMHAAVRGLGSSQFLSRFQFYQCFFSGWFQGILHLALGRERWAVLNQTAIFSSEEVAELRMIFFC